LNHTSQSSETRKEFLSNTVVNGENREVLRLIADATFDMCVTSPPYFRLREYSRLDREIGRETTPIEFIASLLETFTQVHRTLKPGGSLWVNIDDTWEGEPYLIPERFAMALAFGENSLYRLRNKVIWYKVDAMSENDSSNKRFTRKYEQFYWFVRRADSDYYFDLEAAKVPVKVSTVSRLGHMFYENKGNAVSRMRGQLGDMSGKIDEMLEGGVNCGDVWPIMTNKVRVEHIAPYPEDLIIRPIVACCPDDGIVLDPFMGSGTTAIAALKMNRNFFGIDINPDSVREATNRVADFNEQGDLFSVGHTSFVLGSRSSIGSSRSRVPAGEAAGSESQCEFDIF
jgi:DNA modification methylase